MLEGKLQETGIKGTSQEKLDFIKSAVDNIEYSSAREHSRAIYNYIQELLSTEPDFQIFYEELYFEGLKFLDSPWVQNNNYSHVNSNGLIVSSMNEAVIFPSNIDILNKDAICLAALKYYIDLKKSGGLYEHGNIDTYSARLQEDLHQVATKQKQEEQQSLEKQLLDQQNYNENIEQHRATIHKQVPAIFEKFGLPLNHRIQDMLFEPDAMQGGRQGSGYTNVFRELGNYINNSLKNPLDLFDEYSLIESLEKYSGQKLNREQKIEKLNIKEKLDAISKELVNPSHIILIQMMRDIIFGSEKDIPQIEVENNLEKIEKAGTCTTAERYYFEWEGVKNLGGFEGGYGGHMKIIADETGQPIMIEKVGMGEKSCLSLVPLKMGQIEIPAGSMLQAITKENIVADKIDSNYFPEKLKLSDYDGFRFLRISTLSLPAEIREAAFGNHYFDQMQNDFVNYNWLETKHYLELIENVLKKSDNNRD
jgi:hypothetical protein